MIADVGFGEDSMIDGRGVAAAAVVRFLFGAGVLVEGRLTAAAAGGAVLGCTTARGAGVIDGWSANRTDEVAGGSSGSAAGGAGAGSTCAAGFDGAADCARSAGAAGSAGSSGFCRFCDGAGESGSSSAARFLEKGVAMKLVRDFQIELEGAAAGALMTCASGVMGGEGRAGSIDAGEGRSAVCMDASAFLWPCFCMISCILRLYWPRDMVLAARCASECWRSCSRSVMRWWSSSARSANERTRACSLSLVSRAMMARSPRRMLVMVLAGSKAAAKLCSCACLRARAGEFSNCF